MTPEQQAADVVAQAACVNAYVASYQAANQIAIRNGEPLSYGPSDFTDLITVFGIHPARIERLYNRISQ